MSDMKTVARVLFRMLCGAKQTENVIGANKIYFVVTNLICRCRLARTSPYSHFRLWYLDVMGNVAG